METAFAITQPLAKAGVLVAAAAVLAVFVLRTPRHRAGAMAVALMVTPVLLISELHSSDQLTDVFERAWLVIAAVLLGLAVVAVLALVFTSRPALLPVFAVAAIPFRVPIAVGDTSASLLVPLYLVIAGGCVAYMVERIRGSDGDGEAGRPGWVELAALAFVAVYAVEALYSSDFSKALDQLVFFFIPFALLLKLLLGVRWSAKVVVACAAVAVALALFFSGVGFWEYETRHLFWNSSVIDANQFSAYFRVNSVFFDPNIFGRFLAVAMLVVVSMMLWDVKRRWYMLFVVVLAVLWGGLLITFSQSSFGSLLVGLAVLAGLRWSMRWTVATTAAALVLGIMFVLVFHEAINLKVERYKSLDNATSGRLGLIGGGLELFADRPLFGQGSGAFSRAYRDREKASSEAAATASHNIVVTVAAEQGLLGLAVYFLLVIAAFVALFSRIRAPPAGDNGFYAARATVAAAFTAVVFHTMVYAAFLEDPIAWTLLGIGLALQRQGRFADDMAIRAE